MAIRIPTHPGDFIRHVYLAPLNLSAAEVAEALEINAGTFSRLLNGNRTVTRTGTQAEQGAGAQP